MSHSRHLENKNAGHDMAIVGEPCNANAHAKILALFINVMHMAAEYVQHHARFVNVQSSLPKNVVFSVCFRMGNAAYIIFIMWSSISGLNTL